MELSPDLNVRNCLPEDHSRIIGVMKDWWNGRDLTYMLPKLFLIHFNDTSFVIEKDGKLAAFLVGFLSQCHPKEAHVNFIGVDPQHRGLGLGRHLYNRFFAICEKSKRSIVKANTSPVNKQSIAFHIKMGFEVEKGDTVMDGVQVSSNYNKPGDHKVLFRIDLAPVG